MSSLDQAHRDGVVVGLRDSGVVPRVDIDELLFKQPETFNLFVIALKELKGEPVPWQIPSDFQVKSSDKLSYFQMAGIHGLPLSEWDGEVAPGKTPDTRVPGYCAHGTPTFGPWHRPYLSLVEQTIFRHVANVAQRFGQSSKLTAAEKQKYVDAAKQFRLPFWDYYRPRAYQTGTNPQKDPPRFDYHLPQIFTLPEIMVKTLPDNKLEALPNPFWQYKFVEGELQGEWEIANLDLTVAAVRDHTVRWGGNDDKSVAALNRMLNQRREDEMRVSLSMIEEGAYSNFLAFSTSGVVLQGKNPDTNKILRQTAGSIEDFHGSYHVFVGGFSGRNTNTGHMSSVPVAAFDPVFWMHHCQIDRLFAIWQAVNPSRWFDDLPPAQRPLADSSTLPFRRAPLTTDPEKRYWTCNQARGLDVFGYTYPDVADASKSPEQLRADFAARYGWSRRLTPFQSFGAPPADMLPLDLSKAQVYQYTSGSPAGNRFRPVVPVSRAAANVQLLSVAKSGSQQDGGQPQNGAKASNGGQHQNGGQPQNGGVSHDGGQAQAARLQAEGVQAQAPVTHKVSHEWYIDSVVERLALNGAFTIIYIIGDVSGESGADWATLPGLAGVTHVFAAPVEACDNCGSQAEQAHLVTSTSAITSLLLDYVESGKLASMEARDVEPFLVKNLKWRVQTTEGQVVDPRTLSSEHSLKLSISCKTAPLPGETGEVEYSFYPQIIDTIIANSSRD